MTDSKKENLFEKLARRNEPSVSETVPTVVAERSASEDVEEPDTSSPSPPETPSSRPPRSSRQSKKKEEPKGKREHPDYVQANAYVPKTVRKAVDRELVDIDGLDYSTLVTDLLRKWLKSRGVSV